MNQARLTHRQQAGLAVLAGVCLMLGGILGGWRGGPAVAPEPGPFSVGLRVRGEVAREGLYLFDAPPSPGQAVAVAGGRHSGEDHRPVPSGHALTVAGGRIEVARLGETERMLLGLGLDLNLATVEDLVSLGGVGTALAQRIVEIRRRQGGFRSIEEIMLAPGVGPAMLTRLRPWLTLGPGRHENVGWEGVP